MVSTDTETDLRFTDNIALGGIVRSVLAGSSGITTLEMDGGSYYIAYAPMSTVGWGFLTVLGEEEVLAPTNNLLAQMDIHAQETVASMEQTIHVSLVMMEVILVFFCLLVALLAFLLSSHIVKPIQLLTESVGKLDGDNLDFTWDVSNANRSDETTVLAGAFLDMTKKMKEYIVNIT